MIEIDNKLFSKWLKDEQKKLGPTTIDNRTYSGKRTYLHFDKRRSDKSLFIFARKFLNKDEVLKHCFWPFMKLELSEVRIKNNTVGKRKKEFKKRAVYYASHDDSLLYSWYAYQIQMEYEKILKKEELSDIVLAYRKIPISENSKKNKCNIQFAKDVFAQIKTMNEPIVLVADITGFFDNLAHDILLTEWKNLFQIESGKPLPKDHKLIFDKVTKFKYVNYNDIKNAFNITYKKEVSKDNSGTKIRKIPMINEERILSIISGKKSRKMFRDEIVKKGLVFGNQNLDSTRKCKKGIIQGSPISAILSNIYMLNFDKIINEAIGKINGAYYRYSDDIIVIVDNKYVHYAKKLIFDEIKNLHLEINPSKVEITSFKRDKCGYLKSYDYESGKSRHLQYLGFNFDGKNAYLRSKSIHKYYRMMKKKIRKSVALAYGKKSKVKPKKKWIKVYTKKIYIQYIKSYNNRRSFLAYALKANKVMNDLNEKEDTIKKQLNSRFKQFFKYKQKKERARYSYTRNRRK